MPREVLDLILECLEQALADVAARQRNLPEEEVPPPNPAWEARLGQAGSSAQAVQGVLGRAAAWAADGERAFADCEAAVRQWSEVAAARTRPGSASEGSRPGDGNPVVEG